MNSDILGLSSIETRIISVAEVVANIIIPLAIIVTVSFKKDLVSIVLLVSRSFINCIPVVIYAIENNQINKSNVGVIALNIVYIAILTSVCFVEISNKVVMTLVVICRMMIIFFSGNLYHLLYGLENGGAYLLPNVSYLVTSELLFILPVIYCNGVRYILSKTRSHWQRVELKRNAFK